MARSASGWNRRPIVELCEAHVDCVNRTAPVVSGPTPFKMLRTTNVRDGYVDVENVRYVTEETFAKWTRRLVPKKGDIVLTREAPLGNVGKIRTDDKVFLGQRLYHFRADPTKLDPDFLLYSLLGDDLQRQIKAFGSGSTVEHMRLEDIPSLEINLPSILVQRRIAGILSTYDDLIENCQRRINILESMARGLYREWFVHFRFPGHEKHPGFSTPPEQIPRGWQMNRLGDIAEEVRRNVPKGRLAEPVPYVGLEHIPRRALALDSWEATTDLGSNKLQFQTGEILFGKIRPYFHKVSVAPFDGLCSADTIVIRPRVSKLYAVVVGCVSSDEFVAYATSTSNGSKMPRASWAVLQDYPVPVPSPEIAQQFAEFLEPAIQQMQKLVGQIQSLRRTRDLLLPRLLTGQIDVGELEAA